VTLTPFGDREKKKKKTKRNGEARDTFGGREGEGGGESITFVRRFPKFARSSFL
jgi:hypothetical protein